MAASFVQRIATGTASPLSLTVSTTAGNTVLLAVKASAGGAVTAVSDSRGNTWTVDKVGANTSGARASLCSAPLTTALLSGDTITITLSAGTVNGAAAYEVAGLATVSPVDQSNQANATTGTSGSAAVTTTNANDYVFTVIGEGSTQASYTVPTGFTERPSGQLASSVDAAELVVAATGTYTANWSWPTTGAYSLVVVAYKAAATAKSSAPENRLSRRNSLLRR